MEVLSKIISFLMTVVLLFLLPLDYLLGHQKSVIDGYVKNELSKFVDDIRTEGCLKVEQYEEFVNRISDSGMYYAIELEHAIPREGNNLSAMEDLPGAMLASTYVDSLPYYHEEYAEISSYAAHAHTEECYSGHRHTTECYMNSNINVNVTISSSNYSWGISSSVSKNYSFRYNSTDVFWLSYTDTYSGIGDGSYRTVNESDNISIINSSGTYLVVKAYLTSTVPTDGYSAITCHDFFGANPYTLYIKRNPEYDILYNKFIEWRAYNSSRLAFEGTQYSVGLMNYHIQDYFGYPVGLVGSTPQCGIVQDTVSVCNQVVTSITATSPTQSVEMGEGIITTATATYLDGHTGTVSCTSNFNPNVAGTQIVTLTYSGLVGNAKTIGTRTCTTNVTVRGGTIPASLTVTPSSYTVYHGQEPTYYVKVTYVGGSIKVLSSGYTITGWSPGPGTKILTFTYTESNVTVTAGVTIVVKPNITSITVTSSNQTVERYTEPVFTVRASYEDGSNKEVAGASITGFDKTKIGEQTVTATYTENMISFSSTVTVTVTPMRRVCSVCNQSYFLSNEDFDTGCPVCKTIVSYLQVSPGSVTVNRGDSLNVTVTATFLDGHTEVVMGWVSNFDPYRSGLQLVMVTFQGKFAYVSVMVVSVKTCTICGETYSLNEDGSDPGCPSCKTALVSISATPEYQSVNQGEDITLAVTGTFRDGHTEELQDWYSNYNRERAGEQLVTVYYDHFSCNVTVEVFSALNITCPVCSTVYHLREHPWGCPVCADTLTGIEATLQNGGFLVPYGEKLDLRVVLIYRDGHRAIAFEGWTDTFDPYTLGNQTISVSYTDRFGNTVSTTLRVEVTDKLIKRVCENGHVYYTEDPQAECPYCASGIILQEQYYSISFTEEILEKLYRDGVYRMDSGDYITVKVIMKTQGSIYSFSLFHKKKDSLPITYGGEVA